MRAILGIGNPLPHGRGSDPSRDRKGAVGSCLICLLACAPMFAAVTGTVTNQTTGKPQAGATVALYQLATATGLSLIDQAKSDAQGNFTINQTPRGPHLIRTAFDGVTYNHMLPPGQPTTGIAIEVYNASKQPGGAKVSKHMILFEPSGGQMAVSETYLFTNDGKTAWNDPDSGTLKFFLPAGASKPEVKATAPGGMPLGAPVNKTSKPDVMAVDFAIKPGDTRVDVSYTMPYTEGAELAGKVISKDENTYLIVPSGVTLKGDGLNDLGAEPRTQAHIFGLTGGAYKVQLTGAVAAAPADTSGDAAAEDAGPRIEQIMPRVNSKTVSILIVALGILALGFALLYRAKAPELRSDGQARRPVLPK
jgi:Carboxypeptidase regulatory-like domain